MGVSRKGAGKEAEENQPASQEEDREDVIPARLGEGLSRRRMWWPHPGPGEVGRAFRVKETACRKGYGQREQREFEDPREVARNAR